MCTVKQNKKRMINPNHWEENDNFELYWVYCWAQWVQKLKNMNKQYVYCKTEQADI